MVNNPTKFQRPVGILIVTVLTILFGLAEVVTGFTHQFFGVTTVQGAVSTYSGAAIGLLYVLAGICLIPMKARGAALAIICLAADVAGRIAMVLTGLFPLDSPKQIISIAAGTLIAAAFAVYIGLRWKTFG